jgi:hypothetical protein
VTGMEAKILEGSDRDNEPWLEGRMGHSPPLRVGSIMAVFISHDASELHDAGFKRLYLLENIYIIVQSGDPTPTALDNSGTIQLCNVHLKLITITSLMISMPPRSKREIIVAISLNSQNLPRNDEINFVTLHRAG